MFVKEADWCIWRVSLVSLASLATNMNIYSGTQRNQIPSLSGTYVCVNHQQQCVFIKLLDGQRKRWYETKTKSYRGNLHCIIHKIIKNGFMVVDLFIFIFLYLYLGEAYLHPTLQLLVWRWKEIPRRPRLCKWRSPENPWEIKIRKESSPSKRKTRAGVNNKGVNALYISHPKYFHKYNAI